MKRIRTITYHSAYNYGAVLQAYALQETIKKIAEQAKEKVDIKIINLQNKSRDINYNYSRFTLKNLIKNILTFNKLIIKKNRYEEFFKKYYNLTKIVHEENELRNEYNEKDYLICGSDQIWNTRVVDFDWSYYLGFTNTSHKISYAPSFGQKKIEFTKEEKEKIKKSLTSFEKISVRDEYSKGIVASIANKESEILVDPTMLISSEEWDEIISSKRIVKEKYILVYLIEKNKKADDIYKKVSKLAKQKKIKAVIIVPNIKIDWKYSFIKKYDAAAIEFLNLIKYSEYVITTSFHGTIFSILFNKNFITINGLDDNRINTLLTKNGLEMQSIKTDEIEQIDLEKNVDFSKSKKVIEKEKNKSMKYLRNAIFGGNK